MSTIAAVFSTRTDASEAIEALLSAGFLPERISVVTPQDLSDVEPSDHTTEPSSQAVTGAFGGAAGGLAAGALASIGLAVLPGLGWVLAAGPVATFAATALLGGAAGAASGGLAGAFIDSGIDRLDAELYEEAVQLGGTVVVVSALPNRHTLAINTLRVHNPIDLKRASERWSQEKWTNYSSKDNALTGHRPFPFERYRHQGVMPLEGFVRFY